MSSPAPYRLRLGEVVVELLCPDPDTAAALARYFDRPSDPAAPTVSLRLHMVEHDHQPTVPSSLILGKRLVPGGFDLAQGLVSGTYDPATGRGDLHVLDILSRGRMTRIFEQILYQAFHAACRRTGWDAALVHSSAVVRDGRGFLFVGPSDAGKSTIADLSGDALVLNDEMNLVEFRPGGPWLLASPFNGHYRHKRPGEAPLAAILLPHKGPRHRLEPVGPGEAAAHVAAQVAPPVPLDELADASTLTAMLDTATRLVQAVPVRRMVFLPDAGFWPEVLRAFPLEQRGR
ncbi:MAG: hypothetical protein R3D98_15125 [Candidatus Krumholzibacteriia bacterium]